VKTICGLFVLLAVGFVLDAQEAPREPTLAETKAWIESEGPAVLKTIHLSSVGPIYSSVSDLVMIDCHLSWKNESKIIVNVPLKDLDVGGVILTPSALSTAGDENLMLRLKTRSSIGPTISKVDMGKKGKQDLVDTVVESVRTQGDGNRLVAAIRRAAILCGAPASPF